jgi:gas vesicle protein
VSDDRGHTDLALAFAFLAGALLGAGIAILLAPQSGAETREQVAAWAKRAQEKTSETVSRLREASRTEG